MMKVLIAYDSVSPMKLTAKVAETISAVLKENGGEVNALSVGDIDIAKVGDYGCLIVGGPTMAFRMSRGIKQFLQDLPNKEFLGKPAAAFDTQLQSRMSGSAAKGIESMMKRLGFKMITAPLVTYVEGKMNEMHLKDGELEKAKSWAQEVAKCLSK
jgi:flavodoxin